MSSTYDNTPIILILFFVLVLLVILLFYLYKRLNYETKNKYTIQKLVLGEGGLRDRVRHGVAVVEARVGDRLRSKNQDEEQALSRAEDEKSDKEDEGEEEDAGQGKCENENKTEEKEEEHDSSDDYSSIDLKERVKQNTVKEEEKKEEEQNQEEVGKDEAKGDDSKQAEEVKKLERVSLLVDLKPFSGSAIWSEEKKEESNVTALWNTAGFSPNIKLINKVKLDDVYFAVIEWFSYIIIVINNVIATLLLLLLFLKQTNKLMCL